MNLISGKRETSSRLPVFSLFLPGSCPNYRDRRTRLNRPVDLDAAWKRARRDHVDQNAEGRSASQ